MRFGPHIHRLTSLTYSPPPPLLCVCVSLSPCVSLFLIIFEIKFQIRTMIDWSRIFPEKVYVINHKLIVALPWFASNHRHRIRSNIHLPTRADYNVLSTFLFPFRCCFCFCLPELNAMTVQCPNKIHVLSMRQTHQYTTCIYYWIVDLVIWSDERVQSESIRSVCVSSQYRHQFQVAITQWHQHKVYISTRKLIHWNWPTFF